MKRPSVYEYLDFRGYLKDMYSFFKEESRGFSFRRFAELAGFASPNFLKLVYDGDRNITVESLQKISKAFKLNQAEASFLEDLAMFNQADTQEKKNFYYERMLRSRHYRDIKSLEKDQFDYYSQWYHIPIRELVETEGFKEDPEWIANRLQPSITAKQAEDAIELLLKLELIKRDAKGNLRQSDANVSTGPEVRSLAVMNYHKEMMNHASRSLDEIDGQLRDISAVTLNLSQEHIKELKNRVYQFRKGLLSWASSVEGKRTDVYQMNIQIFPMTKVKGSSR